MVHISLIGVNHQKTPIPIREKVAISPEKLYDALLLLRSRIPQGIILSTCNRTEIYSADSESRHAEEASLNFLKEHLNIPDTDLPQYVYILRDKTAVEHLFRTASGLESMIVGEFEVLGQVGQALEIADEAGMVNLPLRHVFQSAIRTGRRVREQTDISKNAVSVSSVAVDLATRIVGDLRSARILVIGAGEAGKLVIKVARERGASRIVVASRTIERAEALATTIGGMPISLSSLTQELSTADLVVTCSGAPHWVLDVHRVTEAMAKRPELPLVIIDIAVPRNVEPATKQIRNAFLYNIDDLIGISSSNLEQRADEIQKATDIVKAEVDKLVTWWQSLEVRNVIRALMSKSGEIRSAQLNKTLKKLRSLSNEERESLEAMTESIVTKILKDPVQYLKANADGNWDYAEMVTKLFRLNTEEPG